MKAVPSEANGGRAGDRGPPHQGKSASFIWAPPSTSASMDAFLCLEISPGMEEDFERCSVTLITFRTGHHLLLGCADETGSGCLWLGIPRSGVLSDRGSAQGQRFFERPFVCWPGVRQGAYLGRTWWPARSCGLPCHRSSAGADTASPGHRKKGPWTSSGGRASSLQSRTPRAFLQLQDWPEPWKLLGCCSRSAPWPECLTHPHTPWWGPQVLMLFSNPSLHLGRQPQTSTPTGELPQPRCPDGLPASSTLKTSPSALCSSDPERAPPGLIPLPGSPPQLLGPRLETSPV